MGYSAMGDIDTGDARLLATGGLTETDIKPVRVPNVVRSADDFMAGNADMFFFAFGGPKVREADATVGGIRPAGNRPGRHAGSAQDHALGLSDPDRARPGLHRRREAR